MAQGRSHAAVRIYGLAGLLGASAFVASLVVLHLTRTDVDWTRHYVSDFVNGRLGGLFVAGTLAHGAGNLGLILGLRQSLDPGPLRGWAAFFFGLAVAGIVVAAIFPIEAAGRPPTAVGLIHRVTTIASFPLELGALFLFSAAFGRDPRWRRRQAVSLALSAVATAAMAGFFLAAFLHRLPGLAERLALAGFLAWEVWASAELARAAAGVGGAR
ncbi:MAG TPA: DUF998 domain-containing protein [Thiobacillus sp.]